MRRAYKKLSCSELSGSGSVAISRLLVLCLAACLPAAGCATVSVYDEPITAEISLTQDQSELHAAAEAFNKSARDRGLASGEASRAMVNPCSEVIADPFYSGVSLLTTKFIRERPQVARKLVNALDEATRAANSEFERVRPYFSKYTAIKGDQVRILAQPYLRAWRDLNDTDIRSYQALVDVFFKEGVLKQNIDVRTLILKPSDLA